MSGPVATKIATESPRLWHLVDAKNQIIGRLAPQIAKLLVGKHKPTYVPHVDSGDYVVVINAKEAVFTGNKMRDKLYKWHTGWFGGLKTLTARQMHERAPDRLIEHAVKGMVPPNKLRKTRMTRLRIFPEDAHEHARQVAQSQRYAPAYMHAFAPHRYEPPPADGTAGTLIADFFAPGLSAEERAAAEAALVAEEPALGLARLKAEVEGGSSGKGGAAPAAPAAKAQLR